MRTSFRRDEWDAYSYLSLLKQIHKLCFYVSEDIRYYFLLFAFHDKRVKASKKILKYPCGVTIRSSFSSHILITIA